MDRSLELSGSGDIFGASALHGGAECADFSVLVDATPLDLFGDGQDDALFDESFSSSFLPETPEERDTSTVHGSSEEEPRADGGGARKRERPEIPVQNNRLLLDKDEERGVESVEVYDAYMKTLQLARKLTKRDRQALMDQRRRIRNRLYAQNKRQKEKTSGEKLADENERLRRENEALRSENARLLEALKGVQPSSSMSSVPAFGRMGLFALVISFSFFMTPSLVGLRGSSPAEFGTGRSLLSVNRPAQSWMARLMPNALLALPWQQWLRQLGTYSNLSDEILYVMCHTRSNSTREAEIIGMRDWELETSLHMRSFEIPV